MYVTHFREGADGQLEALTNCGRFTDQHIRLYRPSLVRWRQTKRIVSQQLATLANATARLRDVADLEGNYSRREIVLHEVAVLERRIQIDREQFLS